MGSYFSYAIFAASRAITREVKEFPPRFTRLLEPARIEFGTAAIGVAAPRPPPQSGQAQSSRDRHNPGRRRTTYDRARHCRTQHNDRPCRHHARRSGYGCPGRETGGGGGFRGGHIGRGFNEPSLDSVPSAPAPVFNPSSPYTVSPSPEPPVSPASPGSIFGNG